MIFLGRAITAYPAQCAGSEWLVTNGLGGFASGTVAGALTRRYHGLLVTAEHPPLGRVVRFSKVDETLTYDGLISEIYSNQWQSAAAPLIPNGYEQIDYFYLDGATPVWIYSLADALIEKRIWMEQGANTTYVQYTLLRGRVPLELTIRLFATHRDMHSNARAVDGVFRVEPRSEA